MSKHLSFWSFALLAAIAIGTLACQMPARQKLVKMAQMISSQKPSGTTDISGKWIGSNKITYIISQKNNNFTWTAIPTKGRASGKIEGDRLSVSWVLANRKGTATGRITQRDRTGRAIRIEWSNGIIFNRSAAPALPIKLTKPKAPAPQLKKPPKKQKLPDLTIEEISCDRKNNRIGYVIKNTGQEVAKAGHATSLYVDGKEIAHDLVNINLKSGVAHESWFKDYKWPKSKDVKVKVFADSYKKLKESNEQNNSLEKTCKCPIDTTPPKVAISHSPSEITTADEVTFTANATDNIGIAKILIFVNDEQVKECTPGTEKTDTEGGKYWECIYTGGPYEAGPLTYRAEAIDSYKNKGFSEEKSIDVSETEFFPMVAEDRDLDGILDSAENDLLQRFSPYYLFSFDDSHDVSHRAPGGEPYRPTDAIWYIRHGSLIKYGDETEAPVVKGNDILQSTPSAILEANRPGDDWGSSDITINPKRTGYCININNDYRAGYKDGEGVDWPQVISQGNVGLYGHVVPYGRYYKIEYYQFFGYSDTTYDFDVGDHEGDWCTVQLIYDPETDKIIRVLHHAHGKEMSFDMRLTDSEVIFDGDGDGISEVKEFRGPNYDRSDDIDIADAGERWRACNNLVRFYRDPITGEYTHPIVNIENSTHEFWPGPYWSYITTEYGISFSARGHAGDAHIYDDGLRKHYLTKNIPNLGEVEHPTDKDAEIILRYNGRWGAYSRDGKPPGPALHREWTWPVTSTLRRSIPERNFQDGSSMARHWPAVVETLATFGYLKVGLAVGDVDGDGEGEIIAGDCYANRIMVYSSTGSVKYEIPQEIDFESWHDRLAAGDVDGDGIDEIIMAEDSDYGYHDRIRTFQYDDTSHTFTSSSFHHDLEGGDVLIVGDVIADSDNKAEIIVADPSEDRIYIYGDTFSTSFDTSFDNGDKLAIGDINGDGMDEIIMADYSADCIREFYHINKRTAPWERAFHRDFYRGIYPEAGPIAAADVDGDGTDEILLVDCWNQIHTVDQLGNADENCKFFCVIYEMLPGHIYCTRAGEIATGNIVSVQGDEIVYGSRYHFLKVFSPFRDFSPTIVATDEAPHLIEISPIEIDEGEHLDISDYVEVVDPEGGPIDYEILGWGERLLDPWKDGPYDGNLTVKASEPVGNSIAFSVPITVNNVPPSPSCGFEKGKVGLGYTPGGGFHNVELAPLEHNIHVSIVDPGDFDAPWTITVDFGDHSPTYTFSSDSREGIKVHHSYQPGQYTATLWVRDKDRDVGSCQCEFDVVCTEENAPGRNAPGEGDIDEGARYLAIMDGLKKLKIALRVLEAGKATEGMKGIEEINKIREWGTDPMLQNLLDGKMVAYIAMRDGSTMTFKMVFEKGNLKEIDQINEDEIKSFNPSARISTSGKAVVDIIQSASPITAFKLSFERGEININRNLHRK